MFNILKMTYKIDMTYAINSFIYSIKHLPIFKDLFPDNSLYKSKKLKAVIRILGILLSSARVILYKILYFWTIYMIASYLTPKNITTGILHIYFIFTTLGIIINNKILTTNTKKYFSIVLFNMDAKNFMKANFWSDRIINFILHSICLWFLIKSPSIFIFTIFMFLGRFLGERINLLYYKKYKMPIIYNYTIYWTVLFLSLGACLLPLIDTQVSKEVVLVIDMIMIPIAIVCY